MRKQSKPQIVDVAYAANQRGNGVAYVRTIDGLRPPLRIEFAVKRLSALEDREVGYAALTAVASNFRERGFHAVRFRVGDERIVADLGDRRSLPKALTLPYLTLRCALNALGSANVEGGTADPDLTARASAEVEFAVAA